MKAPRIKKALLAGIALAMLSISAATAGVIQDRRTIMTGFNTANNDLLLLTKDTYSPTAAAPLLQVISTGAAKLSALFPPETGDNVDTTETRALATVWSDAPGFQAALAKLIADVKTAQDIKDAASFGAAYTEVASDCQACHRTYRGRQPRPVPAQ
jgi:cytochrome c556